MKELDELLKQLATNDIKKNAVMGAGVGAALNIGKGDVAKNALIGAGLGVALGWALNEFSAPKKTQEKVVPTIDSNNDQA